MQHKFGIHTVKLEWYTGELNILNDNPIINFNTIFILILWNLDGILADWWNQLWAMNWWRWNKLQYEFYIYIMKFGWYIWDLIDQIWVYGWRSESKLQ